jgi:perosamine synthetase
MLPYGKQTIEEDDIQAVVAALRSDWLTTGPTIDLFETAFADQVHARHAVAVSNGTAALHAAMHAIEIGPGDEVILPAITFVATANAVLYQGGRPVFAEVDPHTMLVDVDDIARKITPRTKAIIAVDYAGQPCDYSRLGELALRHHLILVADACHSLGASYQGRPVGSLADLTCFSLHPVKPITTGEGGIVTTNNRRWSERIRQFRNHGISSDFRQRTAAGTFEYSMVDLGFNFRLTDIQAALGMSQLKKLRRFTNRRREIAVQYDRMLAGSEIRPLVVSAECNPAYHLYVVRWPETRFGLSRDGAFQILRRNGIGANVHYQPVYLHPYYQQLGYPRGLCPVAEEVYQSCLSLPIFPSLHNNDVARVVQICESTRLARPVAA